MATPYQKVPVLEIPPTIQAEGEFTEGVSLMIQHSTSLYYSIDQTFIDEFDLKTISIDPFHMFLYFKAKPGENSRQLTIEIAPTTSDVEQLRPVHVIRITDKQEDTD